MRHVRTTVLRKSRKSRSRTLKEFPYSRVNNLQLSTHDHELLSALRFHTVGAPSSCRAQLQFSKDVGLIHRIVEEGPTFSRFENGRHKVLNSFASLCHEIPPKHSTSEHQSRVFSNTTRRALVIVYKLIQSCHTPLKSTNMASPVKH